METNEKKGRHRILVVEDDKDQRELMALFLQAFGHEISFAENLAETKAKLDWQPDLVLLDLHLPDEPGIEVLKFLSPRIQARELAVIVISASTEKSDVIESWAEGAFDFIRKPFDHTEFVLRVGNALAYMQTHSDLREQEAARTREKMLLKKYFSPDLVESILSGAVSSKVGGKKLYASILVFDIRRSTTLAEELGPDLFAEMLSLLFTDIMDIIVGNGGTVTNFRGDGMLVTFGAIQTDEDPGALAVMTALKIIKHFEFYNSIRPDYLKEPLEVGIGIATGELFVGNIGSSSKIEFTVLGDPANLAARLESLTKAAKIPILVDEATIKTTKSQLKTKRVIFKKIRGKMQEVNVYGILGTKGE